MMSVPDADCLYSAYFNRLFTYKGKRTWKYFKFEQPLFTLGFGAIFVSTLANVAVLVVFALLNFNVIQGL